MAEVFIRHVLQPVVRWRHGQFALSVTQPIARQAATHHRRLMTRKSAALRLSFTWDNLLQRVICVNLVVVSYVFPPEPVGASRTSFDLARELAARGHDVTVIAPFPNRPAGRLYAGYRRALGDLRRALPASARRRSGAAARRAELALGGRNGGRSGRGRRLPGPPWYSARRLSARVRRERRQGRGGGDRDRSGSRPGRRVLPHRGRRGVARRLPSPRRANRAGARSLRKSMARHDGRAARR